MTELHGREVTVALAESINATQGYLDFVPASGLGRVSDADVLAELRQLESLRRRLATVNQVQIGELDRRGVAGRLVMPSAAAVLQGALGLSPGEAADRVAGAGACGLRTGLTGESLPPLQPVRAGAQAEAVSGEHTKVIFKPTSSPGPTAARRILKISPWSADITTASWTAPAGLAR